MSNKPKIIFLGPLPPPHMGPSIATEIILQSNLNEHFQIIHLDTSDYRGLKRLAKLDFTNIFLAFKHYFLLLLYILRFGPQIVYIPICQTTIGYLRDSGFLIIAHYCGCKIVCHLRGGNFKNWYLSSSKPMQRFIRQIHSLVDAQIVLGECLKHLFAGLIVKEKIFVVPNGRNFPKEILPQKKKKVQILYLANFSPSKGVLDALKAFSLLQLNNSLQFVFAGSWLNQKIKKDFMDFLAQHPNLPVSIIEGIYGKEKYQLLANSDIFVFPPHPQEGHPWVIVEAMAYSLPIITTDVGCIKESVIDNANGFLIPHQNPQAIAEKINILLANPGLQQQMGNNSYRLYKENFTQEKMVDNLTHVFYQTLKRQSYGF